MAKRGKNNHLQVCGKRVAPGSDECVIVNIARLPSGTKLDLPVYVFRSKRPGPVVLLSGGLHGDEINGIEIVRRMLEKSEFAHLESGTVIAIPVMNVFGFLNFSREVPDGKDVNRSFPGSSTGSLAARVAHFLTKEILPLADFGIDFHTGGASRFNFPQVRYASSDSKAFELAQVFGAPVILQSGLIDKSLRKQAHKMNCSILVYEGGESLRINEEVIQEGIKGAKRVLKHLGMLATAPQPSVNPVVCSKSTWIRAKRSGIYRGQLISGMAVAKNDLLGRITDPFGDFSIKVKSPQPGFIIGHNNMPVVNQGDALLHLGLL